MLEGPPEFRGVWSSWGDHSFCVVRNRDNLRGSRTGSLRTESLAIEEMVFDHDLDDAKRTLHHLKQLLVVGRKDDYLHRQPLQLGGRDDVLHLSGVALL